MEMKCDNIKQVYQQTAENNMDSVVTQDEWKRTEERRKIKEKNLNTKSSRVKEPMQKDYGGKDKEVKRSARKNKRSFVEERAEEAEKAAIRDGFSTVYKFTKELNEKDSKKKTYSRASEKR